MAALARIIHESQAWSRSERLPGDIGRTWWGPRRTPPFPRGLALWRRDRKRSDETTSDRGEELRAPQYRLANCAEVVEERPRTGEEHADATSRYLDAGGDFDQPHPPRTSVTFTKRVCFATTVEVSTARTASACLNGNGILFQIVAGTFFRRRIGDLLS